MDWFEIGNALEAALWVTMAIGFGAYAMRVQGGLRRRCLMAAVLLAMFGLSDIIEISTGAWWRPWWLLAWKVACVAGLAMLLAEHVLRQRSRSRAME
jgi:hypothetical protein